MQVIPFKKHFVVFMSPGTFLSETTEKKISSWDVNRAKNMAKDVKQRHGATPYGFYFYTTVFNTTIKKSNMYFLGGTVRTLEEIKSKNDPEDSILISNMESAKYNKVITINNSYPITVFFKEEDVILNY